MTAAIETDGLTKRYGTATALDGFSLSVESGTVFGLLGPNGAGKTTTLRLLTSLTRPTSGTARVAGVPVTDRERLVEHIGYLPESPPISETLTGREQLEYHGGLRGMDRGVIIDRIERLLDRFDLRADADQRIVSYSKGMRQKVGVIQAVMHDPDVVFLDEPTSGLDPQATAELRELVTELATGGTTVVLSTHVLPVVEEVATVVGVLQNGRLVENGDPDVLVDRMTGGDATLEDVFLELTTDSESKS